MSLKLKVDEIRLFSKNGILADGEIHVTGISGVSFNDLEKLKAGGWDLDDNILSNAIEDVSEYNIAIDTDVETYVHWKFWGNDPEVLNVKRLGNRIIKDADITFKINDTCEFKTDAFGKYTQILCQGY